ETDKGDRGECNAAEASKRIKTLLPKKTTVWLEQDETNRDGKDRLLGHVWVAGMESEKPSLLNEQLIKEGFASFKSKDDNTLYDARLKKAKRGLWGACAGPHAELTPPPPHLPMMRSANPVPDRSGRR